MPWRLPKSAMKEVEPGPMLRTVKFILSRSHALHLETGFNPELKVIGVLPLWEWKKSRLIYLRKLCG